MATIRKVGVLLAAVLLGGCLPIELDVSSDGRVLIPRQEGFFTLDGNGKVVRVYKPESGQPVFGRFVAGDKQIVAVTETGSGGGEQTFELVTLADGKARKLGETDKATYVTISPDGKTLAFTRVSDESTDLGNDNKESLPELHLIDLEKGQEQKVKAAGGIAGIHRWFPDSKSLLIFQITGKVKENNLHVGTLSRFDIAAGKATPLAAALGGNNVFFSLSPDGRTVLFTGSAAGKPGEELKAGDSDQLFELKVDTGQVRQVRKQVKYALFSPKGTQVLVGGNPDEGKLKLAVADATLSKFTTIANDASGEVGGGPGDATSVYPAWLSDSRIAYIAVRAVFGRAGKNLELVFIDSDGKNRADQQTIIDAEAGK